MERTPLRAARLRRAWSLEQAAEQIGIGRNTLWRWEHGSATPYAYNVQRLCKTYGMTALELGLEKGYAQKDVSSSYVHLVLPQLENDDVSLDMLTASLQHDMELRLQYLVYDWLYRKKPAWSLATLQARLSLEIESCDQMKDQNYQNHQTPPAVNQGRRDALRRLALLPLQALGLGGLGVPGTKLTWVPADILTHCAAGITACEHLGKGWHEDITLASTTLSAYVPVLKAIVKESSVHRKEAARLAGQALLLKTTLSVHREGPKRAARYAEQGLVYSQESGYLPLHLTILRRLAWVYACDRQSEKAAEKMVEARYLLEHAAISLPTFLQSSIYSAVAKHQAFLGQKDEVTAALRLAHDTFPSSPDENMMLLSMTDHDLAQHFMDEGLAYYRLGRYDQALATFDKVINHENLALKMPFPSKRARIELINHEALALLKRPRKDMELSIQLWRAGLEGAQALQSEQRLNETLAAYDIMQALWPDEKRVLELRELTRRW